jgi:hypothetical protein
MLAYTAAQSPRKQGPTSRQAAARVVYTGRPISTPFFRAPMKLKRIVKNEPMVRLTASIKASTLALLESYQAYYRGAYGEEVERSALVDEILREFINSDKDFAKKPANK